MAAELGLSPSYLNLIERNQRPLTVQVLLKLSAVYGIDVAELSGDERAGAVEALKEIFSDPLLAGEIASPAELSELAEAAPNAARGVARLYAAWREALERLSDLSQRMASGGRGRRRKPPRGCPRASAAPISRRRAPGFRSSRRRRKSFAERLAPRDDPAQALKAHLRDAFGIDTRILPRHVMPVEQARYDRHSLRPLHLRARAARRAAVPDGAAGRAARALASCSTG